MQRNGWQELDFKMKFKKERATNVNIFDYVFYGGYSHLPDKKLPSKNELEEMYDEKYPEEISPDGNIYTISGKNLSIEFTYLPDGEYSHDSLIDHESITVDKYIKYFKLKYPEMTYEVYGDKEKLNLIFSNGVFAVFNMGWGSHKSKYALHKIYSKECMSDAQMELFIKLYKKVELL